MHSIHSQTQLTEIPRISYNKWRIYCTGRLNGSKAIKFNCHFNSYNGNHAPMIIFDYYKELINRYE